MLLIETWRHALRSMEFLWEEQLCFERERSLVGWPHPGLQDCCKGTHYGYGPDVHVGGVAWKTHQGGRDGVHHTHPRISVESQGFHRDWVGIGSKLICYNVNKVIDTQSHSSHGTIFTGIVSQRISGFPVGWNSSGVGVLLEGRGVSLLFKEKRKNARPRFKPSAI